MLLTPMDSARSITRWITGYPVIPTGARSAGLNGAVEALDALAGDGVGVVEALAEEGDQVGHVVGGEAERAGADVVAPEGEDHDLRLLVPGHAHRAVLATGVEEDLPGAGDALLGHGPL